MNKITVVHFVKAQYVCIVHRKFTVFVDVVSVIFMRNTFSYHFAFTFRVILVFLRVTKPRIGPLIFQRSYYETESFGRRNSTHLQNEEMLINCDFHFCTFSIYFVKKSLPAHSSQSMLFCWAPPV